MASMGGGAQFDMRNCEKRLRGNNMVNKTLQQICAHEGMAKDGVKSSMQLRILERLRLHAANKDIMRFNRLKNWVEDPNTMMMRAGLPNSASPGAPLMASNHLNPYNNMGAGISPFHRAFAAPAQLEFKPSPFYVTQEQLGEIKECSVMAAHRHTVNYPLSLTSYPALARIGKDPALRVLVFCSAEASGKQDISFPHQCELKVNGGEVKANLRGLKNKPGSTRPVNITSHLRLTPTNPSYSNSVEMTYALTTKKFYLVIYVVKVIEVEELVRRLENGKRITKEKVISDMQSKARDTDIVATASVLSLKCPLSTLRMMLPCRGLACRHNQCFDGTSYLQLQEQGPTWLCPLCNQSAPFDSLVVDEYVKDILKSTSSSVDQVTIHPDGRWELRREPEHGSKLNGVASTSDDDDDLIEVTKSGDSVKMGTPRISTTPSIAAPQAGLSSTKSTPTISSKRPISAVIDLTSSGDEEEPVRAPKRPFTGYPQQQTATYRPQPPPPPPPGQPGYGHGYSQP